MTRSFDVFDRDDFRSPDDLDRGASGGSESFWSARVTEALKHVCQKDKGFQTWLSSQHTKVADPTKKGESFQLELK